MNSNLAVKAVSPQPTRVHSTERRSRARNRAVSLAPIGRFGEEAGKARVPANGLAQPRRTPLVQVTVGAVQDPYDKRKLVAVSINRKTDILEWEYSHHLISHAAYTVGRELQAVFERATGRSQSNWSQGDRVDAFTSKEMQLITGLMKAQDIIEYMDRVTKAVGQVGARHLKAVLHEGKSWADLAAARGRSNEAGQKAAASQFRYLLEDLAEAFAAKGARS